MSKLFNNPIKEINNRGIGKQKIYRFKNDYGASVVQFPGRSFTKENEWELAVLRFYGKDNLRFNLEYESGITDDVIGHLSEEQVESILKEIKKLKKVENKKDK